MMTLRACNFVKNRLQDRCFLVKFEEHLQKAAFGRSKNYLRKHSTNVLVEADATTQMCSKK